jgi:hypothetical protein
LSVKQKSRKFYKKCLVYSRKKNWWRNPSAVTANHQSSTKHRKQIVTDVRIALSLWRTSNGQSHSQKSSAMADAPLASLSLTHVHYVSLPDSVKEL